MLKEEGKFLTNLKEKKKMELKAKYICNLILCLIKIVLKNLSKKAMKISLFKMG